MNDTKIMMPSADLLQLAKQKAKKLTANTQIRLGGGEYEKSYWVYNFAGFIYIGTEETEKLEPFFKDKQVYTMSDKNSKPVAQLQKLN